MKLPIISVLICLSAVSAFSEELRLENLTVTAQKVEQKEHKTPVTMDTFTDLDLDKWEINDLKDIGRYAPNVHVKSDNVGTALVIRGVAPFATTLAGPVGIFIDGVALPTQFMQQPELPGVERVEVLKGPQGTLYGRNTESGVVNIIFAKPDNQLVFDTGAEYYIYDTDDSPFGTKYRFSVSGPLVKNRIYAALSYLQNTTDGYFTNEYNHDDKAGEKDRKDISLRFRITPSNALDINYSLYHFDADDAKGRFRFPAGAYATPEYTVAYNDAYNQQYKGTVHSLNTRYHVGRMDITSITGCTDYSRNFTMDFDISTANRGYSVLDLDDSTISQELRVFIDTEATKGLAGVYGFSQKTDIDMIKTFTNEQRISDISSTGYSVFGQVSQRLIGGLSADIGIRYEQTRLEADMLYSKGAAKNTYSGNRTYTKLLPKVALNYEIDNGIIYLSATKGYLSGGVNYALASSKASLIYGEEETMNYELGFKSLIASGRIKLSGSVFYVDMKDKQITQVIPEEMGNMKIDNAAKAHTYGAELGARVFFGGLEIFASGGVTKSKVDDWTASSYSMVTGESYTDYSGNKLPLVPEYTYTLGTVYTHATGLFISGTMESTGDFYHDGGNTLKEDSYTLYHARAGYVGNHITITLWCTNLTDKRYAETQTLWGTEPAMEDAAPRTFGISFDYRY